jgi:hypothetical protein
MQFVFLYGPPAAGKLTVAKLVAAQTGFAIFHNHLIVDAVGAVFPFGTPQFKLLRERFWLDVISGACAEDRSMIFTFQPEGSVSSAFPRQVISTIEHAGGKTLLAYLKLSHAEQSKRIANADRAHFGKLRDPELLGRLQSDFDACEEAMPTPDLVIDTANTSPRDAAASIVAGL